MKIADKHVVVTGAGSGIGAALAQRFAAEGARVVVADLNGQNAEQVAKDINGLAVQCDVTNEVEVINLVNSAESANGVVDLFCSNAGIAVGEPAHAASASNDTWQLNWNLHVMSHVFAARALLPSMIERGSGYLLQMASAAGLLCQIGDAAYSATKQAAVSFAESLAISHGNDGIKVSVICPQYVATPLLGLHSDDDIDEAINQSKGLISTNVVADAVMRGVQKESFLILPHPKVAQFIQFKSADYDKWLNQMRKLRCQMIEQAGKPDLQLMYKLI